MIYVSSRTDNNISNRRVSRDNTCKSKWDNPNITLTSSGPVDWWLIRILRWISSRNMSRSLSRISGRFRHWRHRRKKSSLNLIRSSSRKCSSIRNSTLYSKTLHRNINRNTLNKPIRNHNWKTILNHNWKTILNYMIVMNSLNRAKKLNDLLYSKHK